jgi:hypothetical protein
MESKIGFESNNFALSIISFIEKTLAVSNTESSSFVFESEPDRISVNTLSSSFPAFLVFKAFHRLTFVIYYLK